MISKMHSQAIDLKTAPDSGSASTTTAAAVSIHDSTPSTFLLQAHNPMLVRKTCKLVWRGAVLRKQTLRLNNGRYGYSGELAQYSSNQNRRWCCASEADSVDSTPPIPAKVPRSGRAPSIRLPSLLASEQYQSLLDRLTFILQVLRTQTGRLGWPSGAFPTDLERRRRTLILVSDVGVIQCGTNTPVRMRFVYIHYSTAPPVPTALTGLRGNGIAKRSLIGLPRSSYSTNKSPVYHGLEPYEVTYDELFREQSSWPLFDHFTLQTTKQRGHPESSISRV
ncbi:uncharacterized protein CLUP02_07378 [Colletotrichum lupini]|uniref:Uncharacterized protein n=1 Tax=Colletotrichum lupini TaxID=145971 RepID=A0A9Q8WGF9_9PEZI|nr:uncharacterized protein CLUP02_07378 [Colletotrichum lupini]UQC81892.1 hypothetical protein CLUP02_07378 [Colletotrichum lupini]